MQNDRNDYVIMSPKGVLQRIESEGRDDRGIAKTKLTARKALDGWRNSRPSEAGDILLYSVDMGVFNRQWAHGNMAKVDLGSPVVNL